MLQNVNKLIDDATLISQERNRFMHDQWIFAPKDLEEGKISRLRLVNLKSWGIDSIKSDFLTMADLIGQHDKVLCMIQKTHIVVKEIQKGRY